MSDWPAEWLIAPRKVTHYLLNDAHKEGGPKARFFLRFGFSAANPNEFVFALLEHPRRNRLARDVKTDAGDRKLVFEGEIQAPDGREPRVRTVWSVDPNGHARFVTAVPLTRD
ncbi:hypothetical protein SAMN02799631_00526 [Methylobacterium sp. 174MFSha1.1]|uniref:DUF6883 domain-containing protein n=1 Tax=Methylobacterium sp. 174MFSha1.1 TaxID=1502749 RepID=UPI0008E5F939|nr:DUF6883 domain-containing protein [Methylobacterium sp. 174MFSha1.1]SFU41088.1 hypothetical protein SAMN02799631_00526 [Methylobacterium sp. 174MFSha1.1]